MLTKNANTIAVNPCKLDEIAARVVAVHAMLDLIHDSLTENPAADAVYGVLFSLNGIASDIDALTAAPTREVTA